MATLRLRRSAIAAGLALAVGAPLASAQTIVTTPGTAPVVRPAPAASAPTAPRATSEDARRSAQNAVEHVNKALEVVRKMSADPDVKKLLQQAKGMYVVPDYARVVWSDTEGAFPNASVSATDINHDENETRAYFNRAVDPQSVAAGDVKSDKADQLLKATPR